MALPTFNAEASLYRSLRLYRGYSGRATLDTASNVVGEGHLRIHASQPIGAAVNLTPTEHATEFAS